MRGLVPTIVIPKNWYEGENVCVSEKEEPMTGSDPFEGISGNSRDVSTTCKGDMYKYVCVSKTRYNGVTKQTVKTYQCCPGFVRTSDGSPGCIEGQSFRVHRLLPSTHAHGESDEKKRQAEVNKYRAQKIASNTHACGESERVGDALIQTDRQSTL
ncbi:hypothetical protein AVEN_29548-1 [Araneus ventricosus]|uniref:EMI domain-containing protein n=1 Tax=Araneus ventricosus TaxID=182803 RepID=A0A4Y2PWL8_ARAVE|nr:hypothetical protein AVEN_29548-1 [Araneus ventricosus]